MNMVKLTVYFHKRDVEPPPGELPSDVPFPIIEAILDMADQGILGVVDGYYIYDVEGASKLPGNRAFSRAVALDVYCDDQAAAIQVRDWIMARAETGQKIGFVSHDVDVNVYTGA